MDAFTALLAYALMALAVATVAVNVRGLYNQRTGLEKRKRTAARIIGALAATYAAIMYALFLTGIFGSIIPPAVARPAFLAVLGGIGRIAKPV